MATADVSVDSYLTSDRLKLPFSRLLLVGY